MAIVSRENRFEIESLDLSPIKIRIREIKNNSNELDYLKTQLSILEDVKQKNIELALKYKHLNDKYRQEKTEHAHTKKLMNQYYRSERDLNILDIQCPFLGKQITLVQCNESCNFGYCNEKTNCKTRVDALLQHFRIPALYIGED